MKSRILYKFHQQQFFNTSEQSLKVLMISISLFASIHVLNIINVLELSCNLYMLLKFTIALILLKMMHIKLKVCLQGHKSFITLQSIGGKYLWCILQMLQYSTSNMMKLIFISKVHIIFPIRYGVWIVFCHSFTARGKRIKIQN